LVFVTKYRHRIFDVDAIQRLRSIFQKVCTDFEAQLVETSGQDNHVPLLLNDPPKHSVSSLVNSPKGVSSRLLRLASEPTACMSAASAISMGALNTLNNVGCYVSGNSVLIPPALGTFGDVGRNLFRDLGYRGWDMSLSKDTTFKERLTAQFRVEVFNLLNHPTFGNPWGPYQYGTNDPSTGSSGNFGCACVTADTAASNPVLGSGGNRSIQLGLKLIF
jgi:hypothetical protein